MKPNRRQVLNLVSIIMKIGMENALQLLNFTEPVEKKTHLSNEEKQNEKMSKYK